MDDQVVSHAAGEAERPRRDRRGAWTLVATLFLVLLNPVVSPSPASAHAFLVDTSPRAGERLLTSPRDITFLFSEAIVAGSIRLEVEDATGHALASGSPRSSRGGTRVQATIPRLSRGVYIVNWMVTSAVDGHLEAGEFAFAVRSPAAGQPQATETSRSSWFAIVGTGMFLVGLLAAVGGLVSEAYVWHRIVPPIKVPAPVGAALLVATVGAALQSVAFLSESGTTWSELLRARSGYLILVEAVTAGTAAVMAATRWRTWGLLPLVAGALAATLRGHAATGPWWATAVNAVHVLVAGMWLGALVHLVLVLWKHRRDWTDVLSVAGRRYARLALRAVPILLVAGSLTALSLLDAPGQMLSTPYGRVLLFKLLVVVGALLLAFAARVSLHRTPKTASSLRHLTTVEVATLVVAVILTAVLVNTAPPRPASAARAVLGPAPLSRDALKLADRAGYYSVYLTADQGVLRLEILGFEREPQPVDLTLVGRDPRGRVLELYPRACGRGCFEMEFSWNRGTTRLDASVSHPRWEGGRVRFDIPWPPRPAPAGLLDQVLRLIREEPRLELAESVTSLPGPPNPARMTPTTGDFFASQELYGAGGITNLNYLPATGSLRSVSFYVPGAAMWYRLWIDTRGYLQRERMINPGHRIARRLTYPFESKRTKRRQ